MYVYTCVHLYRALVPTRRQCAIRLYLVIYAEVNIDRLMFKYNDSFIHLFVNLYICVHLYRVHRATAPLVPTRRRCAIGPLSIYICNCSCG